MKCVSEKKSRNSVGPNGKDLKKQAENVLNEREYP
jgi:hypothetical protein